MKIDYMVKEDWEAVRAIYEEGIATGDATFETDASDWEAWERSHFGICRLVVRDDKLVLGWAALSPVSQREAYGGVAEVSVYVASAARGKGFGKSLLEALVRESEKLGVWTLQASIFPENKVSIGLHKKFGFRIVGQREKIGRLHDVWRDVVLMERRSTCVGID
jgi:phosphinothricin acetyltransferase